MVHDRTRREGVLTVEWTSILVAGVSALSGLGLGAWLGPRLARGKPPAPRSEWDEARVRALAAGEAKRKAGEP